MEHINKLKVLAEQLDSMEARVLEGDQVATLLRSLPKSYRNLIVKYRIYDSQATLRGKQAE